MLRLLALALLLANVLFFAWDHELLRGLGLGPAQQSEPQRLAQQVKPEALQLLKPDEFKRIEEQLKAEQAPKECLQAGPFDEAQAATLRQALAQALPDGAWKLEASASAARWIVYMGKYASAEAEAKKRAEVTALNLKIQELENPALEPGFSLGGFDGKAQAEEALAQLSARGLHKAHVVQERAESSVYMLQLPAVAAALKPKLAELHSALGNKPLHACN
jgi:hypothetical protein